MSKKCYGIKGQNIKNTFEQHQCYIRHMTMRLVSDGGECPYSNKDEKGNYVFDKKEARKCLLFAENKKELLKKIARLTELGLEGNL